MDAAALASVIEPAAYRSWKARECVDYDGWQLRYADGFSRRGNSVYPASTSTLPHQEKLDWCRRWYNDRGLDLVVRHTAATEPGLDDVLATAGFSMEGRTDVMIADVDRHQIQLAVDPEPSSAWWSATADLWAFDIDDPAGWRAIIDRIDLPAGFVCLPGKAAGLAIADGEWMGLFEIVVAESARRRGLGSAVTRSLIEWGRREGAERAYLQVVAQNRPAIALYEHLGFARAYTYWYRRDQALAKSPA